MIRFAFLCGLSIIFCTSCTKQESGQCNEGEFVKEYTDQRATVTRYLGNALAIYPVFPGAVNVDELLVPCDQSFFLGLNVGEEVIFTGTVRKFPESATVTTGGSYAISITALRKAQ